MVLIKLGEKNYDFNKIKSVLISEQLRRLSERRSVPYMGRPVTVAVTQEVSVNKQAKQKGIRY
jgi:hypothetical protein